MCSSDLRYLNSHGIEKRNEYQGEEGIVLDAEHVEQCDPLEDEMVYFN